MVPTTSTCGSSAARGARLRASAVDGLGDVLDAVGFIEGSFGRDH